MWVGLGLKRLVAMGISWIYEEFMEDRGDVDGSVLMTPSTVVIFGEDEEINNLFLAKRERRWKNEEN